MKHLRNLILLLTLVSAAIVFAVEEVPHPVVDHSGIIKKKVTVIVDVTNATASGLTVEGDLAFIFITHNGQQISVREANVSNGKAVFKEVPSGDHFQAVPRVKHNNMMYGGRPVSLGIPADKVSAKVEVYDVLLDNSAISVGTHRFAVRIAGQSLVVTESMQLINATDKAISSSKVNESGKSIVIDLSLPKGFKDLHFSQYFVESAIVVTENGFYDIMSMPPGTYNASFTYKIDLVKPDMDVRKTISMPTKEFVVLSQLHGPTIEGLGQPVGKMKISDGTKADYYAASSYKAGDLVSFQITGIEDASSRNTMLIIIIVVLVLVAPIIINIVITSKKKSGQQNVKK